MTKVKNLSESLIKLLHSKTKLNNMEIESAKDRIREIKLKIFFN